MSICPTTSHVQELGVSNDLACSLTVPHPTDLPTEVDNYHELCPLEPPGQPHKSSAFGYVTSTYKATNTKSGQCYCLRRIHGMGRRVPGMSGTRCPMVGCIHSLIHSFIHSFIYSFTLHSFIHFLIHSHFIPSFTFHSFIHTAFIHSFMLHKFIYFIFTF